MKDCLLGVALAVVTIATLTMAFCQGFIEEVNRFGAVAWPVYALSLFWVLVIPQMGKGGTR